MWRSGYLMCPECGSVYYAHMLKEMNTTHPDYEWYCPNYDCFGAELFTIDELMIPTIRRLNKLGYKTEFCCSGHDRAGLHKEHGYIKFQYGCMPDSVPLGWYVDKDQKYAIFGVDTIRSSIDSLAESIQNLEDWVNHLSRKKDTK